jgi:hypothetical protein
MDYNKAKERLEKFSSDSDVRFLISILDWMPNLEAQIKSGISKEEAEKLLKKAECVHIFLKEMAEIE